MLSRSDATPRRTLILYGKLKRVPRRCARDPFDVAASAKGDRTALAEAAGMMSLERQRAWANAAVATRAPR